MRSPFLYQRERRGQTSNSSVQFNWWGQRAVIARAHRWEQDPNNNNNNNKKRNPFPS